MEENINHGEIMFNGNYLKVWRDEGFVYFTVPWLTFHIPHGQDFNHFFSDLEAFVNHVRSDTKYDDWGEEWDKKMNL